MGGGLQIILFQELCFGRMVLVKIQTIHIEYEMLLCVCLCMHVSRVYYLPSTSSYQKF